MNSDYNFFEFFSCEILGKLSKKKEFIEKYGVQAYYNKANQYVPILYENNYGFSFFRNLFGKIRKLSFRSNESNEENK